MNFLEKLRNQPEHIRKLILWTIVIIIALILGSLWIYNSYQSIKNFQPKEFIEQQWIKNIEI